MTKSISFSCCFTLSLFDTIQFCHSVFVHPSSPTQSFACPMLASENTMEDSVIVGKTSPVIEDDIQHLSIDAETDFIVDPLLKYLNTGHQTVKNFNVQEAIEAIKTEGYYHIPSVLTAEECNYALDQIWEFITDVSAGVVRRHDPKTWYPSDEVQTHGSKAMESTKKEVHANKSGRQDVDPWPHTGYSSFPDMFQSLGAGKYINRRTYYLLLAMINKYRYPIQDLS